MPERGFLQVADFISYPLVTYADRQLDAAPDEFPRQPKGIVDAGFILGLDSAYDVGEHHIELYALVVTATDIAFDFRSDAPNLAGFRWLFTFSKTAPFGCTLYQEVTQIGTGFAFPELGEGYLTSGDFEKLLSTGIGTGVHLIEEDEEGNPLYVEPARIHSLVDTYARTVAVCNERRGCPAPCCPPEPSSSSSSSSSSGGPEVEDDAFVYQYGLQGDIDFEPGWNSVIQLDEVNNAIVFGAEIGAGEGKQCVNDQWINYLVDESGLRIDTGRAVTGGCDDCGAYIRSINGHGFEDGKVQLEGGAGVYIVEVGGELVAVVDLSALCVPPEESSSSSSG
jgi:hypothetical protein